jgi:hypothetical protein
MYAAFGMQKLLIDAGEAVNILGGDFLALVVSQDGQRTNLQGFGLGEQQHSHYWIETDDVIVDLGPFYLRQSSSFKAARIPIIKWEKSHSLPVFLRYQQHVRYDQGVMLNSSLEIEERMDTFLEACTHRAARLKGQPKLPSWLLTDLSSLISAANKNDIWAQHAIRFSQETKEDNLPF